MNIRTSQGRAPAFGRSRIYPIQHAEPATTLRPFCCEMSDPQLRVAEVVAAWADERCFANGRWLGSDAATPSPATLHYVASGRFFESGPLFDVEQVPLRANANDLRE